MSFASAGSDPADEFYFELTRRFCRPYGTRFHFVWASDAALKRRSSTSLLADLASSGVAYTAGDGRTARRVACGNTKIENPRITRKVVDREADALGTPENERGTGSA